MLFEMRGVVRREPGARTGEFASRTPKLAPRHLLSLILASGTSAAFARAIVHSLCPQSRLQAWSTLAPWFRCGWLVRRSLRLFGPSWRGCPDFFLLATSTSTSQTRLLTTSKSSARSPADGAFTAASDAAELVEQSRCRRDYDSTGRSASASLALVQDQIKVCFCIPPRSCSPEFGRARHT